MAELSEIDAVRLQRDEYRCRALNAEAKVKRLEMLLKYAEDAAMEEYRLRMAERSAVNGS